MKCPTCGAMNEFDSVFCAECGTKLTQEPANAQMPISGDTQVIPQPIPQAVPESTYQPIPQPAYQPIPQPVPQSAPVHAVEQPVTPRIPPEYKPLSPWAYFGMSLLYTIPFAGFVLLIVMSFAPRNKNLKNFTRSYWCGALIALCTLVMMVLFAVLVGGGLESIGYMIEDLF